MKTMTYKNLERSSQESMDAFIEHRNQRVAIMRDLGMKDMAQKIERTLPMKPLTHEELSALSFVMLKRFLGGGFRLIPGLDTPFLRLVSKDGYSTQINIRTRKLEDFSDIENFPPPTIDALEAIKSFKAENPTCDLYALYPAKRSPDPVVVSHAGGLYYFVCMWGEEVYTPKEAVALYKKSQKGAVRSWLSFLFS